MLRSAQLKAQKASRVKELRAFNDKAEAEKRDLSADELSAYGKTEGEIATLDTDIARAEKLESWERDAAKVISNPAGDILNVDLANLSSESKKKVVRIEGVHLKPQNFKSPEDAYLSGRYLQAAVQGRQSDIVWCREHGMSLAASTTHSTTNNESAGLFMPDQLATAIIDLKETYGVFGRNAKRWQMTADTLTIPRRTGGLTSYYVGENQDMTASKLKFDAVKLTARKLAAVAVYPKELSEGATISIADHIVGEAAYAFAVAEDNGGFIGDGSSTYGGLRGVVTALTATGTAGIYTAATGHTGFETLTLADYQGAVAKLPTYARPRAKWYVSQVGFDLSMAPLVLAAGGNTVTDISNGPQYRFLGYPVEITPSLNSTAGADISAIKCILGDLTLSSAYGDRATFSVEEDRSLYFLADQIAVKVTQRFDIVNHDVGSASVAGPIVALKSAAS